MSGPTDRAAEPGRPTAPAAKPPVLPLILLGLLTLASFAGPFLIAVVLNGGENRSWPPDRPVEWVTLVGISGLVVVLLGLCVTSGLWSQRRSAP